MKSVGIAVTFLYNNKKEVLMQHRGDKEDFYPGYWGCFGGHMENDETPEEALKRELIEELEYKITNPTLLLISEFVDGDKKIITHSFIEKYDETQTLVQHEGQGYGWFAISEALKLKISDVRREALSKANDFLNKN